VTGAAPRSFAYGVPAPVLHALEGHLGAALQRGLPAPAQPGDLVVLAADATGPELPGGNAFSACRALKQDPRVRVLLLVRGDDPFAAEVARACRADGCIVEHAGGRVQLDEAAQQRLAPAHRRPPVEAVLHQLEAELAADDGRRRSLFQHLLRGPSPNWFSEHLADPESGLLCAEYATYKLDEEFKRALRLQQPLTAVLLSIGADDLLGGDPPARARLLADIAGLLLNESRDLDQLARFTPTCFLLLLPGTGADGAVALLDRLLPGLRTLSIGGRRLEPRAGFATAPAVGIDHQRRLLARAEACLQLAQQQPDGPGYCSLDA
jgi:GGDEF domain-containing protein